MKLNKEELVALVKSGQKQKDILIKELKVKDSFINEIINYMGKENYYDMIETFEKSK